MNAHSAESDAAIKSVVESLAKRRGRAGAQIADRVTSPGVRHSTPSRDVARVVRSGVTWDRS